MMTEYFIYSLIPAGKVKLGANSNEYADLLGVSSSIPGEFQIRAKGVKPSIGSPLILPLKGAKQLSMVVTVKQIEPLITPLGAWSAACSGPSHAQFDIKNAQITCDQCHQITELEFVDFDHNTHENALAGMRAAGWQATTEAQICPKCKG